MVCEQSNEINFVVRELGSLRRRDRYEMIATSLLYLRSKFELAGMNTCGSVVVRVRVDVFCYSVTKMENNLEQGYSVKFCVRLGEGATDMYGKIQKAFGNDSLSRAQVYRWHKDFVNEREAVED
jgi:hypothetical protein